MGLLIASLTVSSHSLGTPDLARARAEALQASGTIEATSTIMTGWHGDLPLDPASIPRFVPTAWVAEFRAIHRIERPGAFDGYYEQD